jgi:hypothetical protein
MFQYTRFKIYTIQNNTTMISNMNNTTISMNTISCFVQQRVPYGFIATPSTYQFLKPRPAFCSMYYSQRRSELMNEFITIHKNKNKSNPILLDENLCKQLRIDYHSVNRYGAETDLLLLQALYDDVVNGITPRMRLEKIRLEKIEFKNWMELLFVLFWISLLFPRWLALTILACIVLGSCSK